MSWADELKPSRLTPRALIEDLRSCRGEYVQAGYGLRMQAQFLGLRLLQRTCYWIGWHYERLRP